MGGQKFDFTLKLLDRQESSNDYIMQNLIRKLSSRYLLHYALEITKIALKDYELNEYNI